MTRIYVKRGAVVEAEPFDPSRDDQGVTVHRLGPADTGPDGAGSPAPLSATLCALGRVVNVRVGDWLVRDPRGPYPVGEIAFVALYQPLDEVVTPALEAPPALEGES